MTPIMKISLLILLLSALPVIYGQASCRLDEYLSSNGTCLRCSAQISSCNRCSQNNSLVTCSGCSIGSYLLQGGCKNCTIQDRYCTSCQMINSTVFNCLNCVNSTFNTVTRKCELCTSGYYQPDLNVQTCRSCYDDATRCYNCSLTGTTKNCISCYAGDYLIY